jgi:hypothetical protein
MSDPVESVARAICLAHGGNPDYVAKFHDGTKMPRWRTEEDAARAVIAVFEADERPSLWRFWKAMAAHHASRILELEAALVRAEAERDLERQHRDCVEKLWSWR